MIQPYPTTVSLGRRGTTRAPTPSGPPPGAYLPAGIARAVPPPVAGWHCCRSADLDRTCGHYRNLLDQQLSMRSAPCHGRPSGPTTCGHGTPGSPPTPRPCARTRSRARGERPGPAWKTTPAKCAVVIVVTSLIVGIPLAYGCSTPSRQRCNSSADRPSRVSRPERRQPGLARHRHRHRHRVRKEVSTA